MEDFKTYLLNQNVFQPSELDNIPDNLQEPLHYWLLGQFPSREIDIWICLSEFLHTKLISPDSVEYSPNLKLLLPAKLAHNLTVAPIEITGNTVKLVMADPGQLDKCDEIGLMLNLDSLSDTSSANLEVIGQLASPSDVREIIKRVYGLGAETVENVIIENEYSLSESETADISQAIHVDINSEGYHDAAIIRFVNQLILEAIKCNASDIHLEPYETSFQVRYRIDGMLHTEPVPSNIKNLESAIISRIKIMANLDIAEKRLPQDGQIRIQALGRPIDVRVSAIPTMFGQGLVLRLLDRETAFIKFDNLGMSERHMSMFKNAVSISHGVVLLTGPTGSGKTTTLYSLLNEINRDNSKVITVEDPIEYQLENVSQIQVKPEIGLTFTHSLRSILRHDPDIIMIGEIRDTDTARIAISSAMTGHLVLSTLHTNDATSSSIRLMEMGIEPYLVASALELVAAQRLVRLLCPRCKIAVLDKNKIPDDIRGRLTPGKIFEPVGCNDCRHTGYKGRSAIIEMFELNEEIRNMIIEKANASSIRNKAVEKGMETLYENGLEKINQGITSLAEVYRVAGK